MPPRKPTTPTGTVNVGGVEVTADDITRAIEVLSAAKGIMVRQPLLKANHPLAGCDYHSVAREERGNEGSEQLATKPAFLAALRRLL